MLGTEEVHNSLDWCEGQYGHLNEEGQPFGHGTVPKSRKFHANHVFAVYALVGLETSVGVDKVSKVIFLTLAVLNAAEEVYGVEVCAAANNGRNLGVVHVHLGTFYNLEGKDAVFALNPEGTTTRFALVLNHAADAEGFVEGLHDKADLGIVGTISNGCAGLNLELLFHEVEGALYGIGFAIVDGGEDVVDLAFESQSVGSNDFLPFRGFGEHATMGYIVDVLDKNNVGIYLTEVADKSTVSTRTENEVPLFIASGFACWGESWHIGCWWLDAEAEVDLTVDFGQGESQFLAESLLHAHRHGVVDVALSVAHAVGFGFCKVLFGSGTCGAIGVGVESYETFGEVAIGLTVVAKNQTDCVWVVLRL